MSRLIPCPSCHSHVLVGDRECPHCGIALRTTVAPRATTVLLGLALVGCPGDDTGDDTAAGTTAGSATSTTSGSATGTTSGSATGTTDGTTTATSISGSGDVEYGTPDTGIDDDGTTGGTETDTDGTAGTGTLGEPEYGVPETSSTTG